MDGLDLFSVFDGDDTTVETNVEATSVPTAKRPRSPADEPAATQNKKAKVEEMKPIDSEDVRHSYNPSTHIMPYILHFVLVAWMR